MKILVRILKS